MRKQDVERCCLAWHSIAWHIMARHEHDTYIANDAWPVMAQRPSRRRPCRSPHEPPLPDSQQGVAFGERTQNAGV